MSSAIRDILAALAEGDGSVTTISRRCKISKSTVSDILARLQDDGQVEVKSRSGSWKFFGLTGRPAAPRARPGREPMTMPRTPEHRYASVFHYAQGARV